MNKLIVSALVVVAFQAHAQGTSSSTTSATSSSTSATVAPAAGAATSATSAAAVKPEDAKKWGSTFLVEGQSGIDEVQKNGKESLVEGDGLVEINYKVNPKLKVGLQQLFFFKSNRDGLKDGDTVLYKNGSVGLHDQVLRADYSSDLKILGSDPITTSNRYIIPTSEVSRATGSNGQVRIDSPVNWTLNPRVSVGLTMSNRVSFSSGKGDIPSKTGSDAKHRIITGLNVSYNFSDAFGIYYSGYTDMVSTQTLRGGTAFDARNLFEHEFGMNITLGSWSLNPAIISEVNSNDASGSLMTADSRVLAHDTLSYYLAVVTTF